jgi:hypothetical protein
MVHALCIFDTYGDTNSEYAVRIAFPLQQCLGTNAPHSYVTCALPILVQDEVSASSQTSILEDQTLFSGYGTLWSLANA